MGAEPLEVAACPDLGTVDFCGRGQERMYPGAEKGDKGTG